MKSLRVLARSRHFFPAYARIVEDLAMPPWLLFIWHFVTSVLPYAAVVALVVTLLRWKPLRIIRWRKEKPPPIMSFPGEGLDLLDRALPNWAEMRALARFAGLTFSLFHRLGGGVGYSVASRIGDRWNGIVNVSSRDGDEALGLLLRFFSVNRTLAFDLTEDTVEALKRDGVFLALHDAGRRRIGYLALRGKRIERAVTIGSREATVVRRLIDAARNR